MTDAPAPPLQIVIVPVTPFEQNCMIVKCTATNKAAIIDPGGDAAHILAAVKQVGAEVEKIVLTHGHLDHVGGVKDVVEALKVPVEGPHVGDKWLVEHAEESARKYGFPPGNMKNAWSDRYVEEGETITIGKLTFDILFIPGHSPGSVVYVSREVPLAIVGDVIFQGSIGRTDFPGCDHDALITGIKTKLFALPDNVTCLPGHGPATTIGEERRANPFLQ